MPANLPPQFFEVQKKYREAKTTREKIEALRKMLSIMPKHKGTDHLKAEIKAKISRLEEEEEARKRKGQRASFYIKREGAGQVVMAGLPNSGKSSLFTALTGVDSRVADYPFTTQSPLPGMLNYENIKIQIIDMPPINSKEQYPLIHNLLHGADLLMLIVDLSQDIDRELENLFSELSRYKLNIFEDSFLDEKKRALFVGTKLDEGEDKLPYLREKVMGFDVVGVSPIFEEGLDELAGAIYRNLGIIRVYTKAPGEEPDLTEPLILKKGGTVEDAAEAIHKELRKNMKYALVWGSTKFGGQKVPRDYKLEEGDIIEIHT